MQTLSWRRCCVAPRSLTYNGTTQSKGITGLRSIVGTFNAQCKSLMPTRTIQTQRRTLAAMQRGTSARMSERPACTQTYHPTNSAVSNVRRVATSPTVVADAAKVPVPVGMATGSISGFLSALTGVGGGVFIIPVLRHLTPLTQQACNATSMLSVTISGAVATWSYALGLVPNIPIAVLLCSTSTITATFGVKVASRMSNKSLTKIMGVVLAFMSLFIIAQPTAEDKEIAAVSLPLPVVPSEYVPAWLLKSFQQLLSPEACRVLTADTNEALKSPWKFITAGCFSGFISGVMGVGGGILLTSYLALATDMEQKRVVATSLATMLPVGLSATAMNMRLGYVNVRAGALIGGCSAVTVWIGSHFVKDDKFSNQTLRYTFAVLMAASAGSLLWKV